METLPTRPGKNSTVSTVFCIYKGTDRMYNEWMMIFDNIRVLIPLARSLYVSGMNVQPDADGALVAFMDEQHGHGQPRAS